ncbi:hypothetical protein LMG31506_00772 [Cupriavidus yeoncheonensis]|uniref:Zinc finger/thioredoxin putative domain-containing protein n=1 Tax=Cupriavidus yeoncheonensis TaxID=1462994 RepID=A0A916IQ84_9BURK|nr:DUF3426 domain-containing protein [Cupriavidus yeoncheonensis]CAG2130221.1 hypothetical protein LMG31506_00772 [Cupriavidus yeoncheonensis]
MAAAKLVTRCPACRTAFRLVADQLRLRQGLVRCGHCETVFDAREHLIQVPAPAASAAARSPQPSPEPAAAAPAAPPEAETEARPASSATHFDPGYDPGYDVPALDSPTMMMAPTEEEEASAEEEAPLGQDAHAASVEPAPAAEDLAQPALQEAMTAVPGETDRDGAHTAETPAGSTEHEDARYEDARPTQAEPSEAELADAQPAAAGHPDDSPVSTANGKHHADEAHEASAAIVTAHEPWPTLDRSALGDEEASAHTPASQAAEAPDELADAPAGESAAEPVLRSASEFLRAQTSDSTEAPAAEADTPAEAPASETPHESGHEPGHDYGLNYGPTYGPSGAGTSDAFSATAGAIARENVARRWARQEPQMGPVFAPDFLRQARERERSREAAATPAPPRLRFGWHIAAGVLAVGVVLQGLYLMRGQLAGQFPVLRPVLEAACGPLGCTVPPWRDIDALRIDTSQLQKQDEGSDAYVLAVTLRNQGRATTALPAIELVMTDLQDQLLLRRVLEPSEYLEPAQKAFATHGLRAGTELPVRVRFRTQQAAANYRVLIFYP